MEQIQTLGAEIAVAAYRASYAIWLFGEPFGVGTLQQTLVRLRAIADTLELVFLGEEAKKEICEPGPAATSGQPVRDVILHGERDRPHSSTPAPSGRLAPAPRAGQASSRCEHDPHS